MLYCLGFDFYVFLVFLVSGFGLKEFYNLGIFKCYLNIGRLNIVIGRR